MGNSSRVEKANSSFILLLNVLWYHYSDFLSEKTSPECHWIHDRTSHRGKIRSIVVCLSLIFKSGCCLTLTGSILDNLPRYAGSSIAKMAQVDILLAKTLFTISMDKAVGNCVMSRISNININS